ncbi:MAG: M23 family metallopeptidase [Prevotellaceae bacterium]|jgi:murein DD-endopeptidase MepM/ murein hydrolase activator NlpD|nr:M23 family metallopeptidase [Prevotellaceae bacterium]
MSALKPKKKQGKLKQKYRFVIYDESLKQLWNVCWTGAGTMAMAVSFLLALISLVVVLIAFTPLRELIPGYPDAKTRRDIVQNALRADSLELKMYQWELQLANLNRIVSGEQPIPINKSSLPDSLLRSNLATYNHSKEDSLLRREIERESQFYVAPSLETSRFNKSQSLETIHFFPPVDGVINDRFDITRGHFAIDLGVAPNAVVSATLDGTVILAAWTSETGYVIQLQHRNNIISTYKHNAKLLKKTGEMVTAGETIAIIGNSGETLTTGPHLHFEIWSNGYPIDPEKYIKF